MIKAAGLKVAENAPIELRMHMSEKMLGVYKIMDDSKSVVHDGILSKRKPTRTQSAEQRKLLAKLRKKAAEAERAGDAFYTLDFRIRTFIITMTRNGETKPFWEFRYKSIVSKPAQAPKRLAENELIPRNLLIPYFVPVDQSLTALPLLMSNEFAGSLTTFEQWLSDYTPPGIPIGPNAVIPNIRRAPDATNANPGF